MFIICISVCNVFTTGWDHKHDWQSERCSQNFINCVCNGTSSTNKACCYTVQQDSWVKRDQLDVTCFIISLFNAQHVSDVHTSILRSLRLICWVISWVVLLWFDVCWCYVVVWLWWCGIRMWAEALVLQPAYGYYITTTPYIYIYIYIYKRIFPLSWLVTKDYSEMHNEQNI